MAFFTTWTNPDRAAIPAADQHKLFPIGQKMPLGLWHYASQAIGTHRVRIQEHIDNGLTFYGPYHGADLPLAVDPLLVASRLRVMEDLYPGSSSNFGGRCPNYDGGTLEASVLNRAMQDLRMWVNRAINDQIDVWFTMPEESVSRSVMRNSDGTFRYPNSNCRAANNVRFYRNMRTRIDAEELSENSGVIRCVAESELIGSPENGLRDVGKYREGIIAQIYYETKFRQGVEYPPSGYPFRTTQTHTRKFVNANIAARAISSRKYDKGFVAPLYGILYDIFGASSVQHWKDYLGFVIYDGFISGNDGFSAYHNRNDTSSPSYQDSYDAYYWHVKRLTDLGLDDILLWGRRMGGHGVASQHADSLNVRRKSGPTNADYFETGTSRNWPIDSLAWIDVHLNRTRVLIMSNAHWDSSVVAEIRNKPTTGKVLDVISGIESDIASFPSEHTIEPESYKVFLFTEQTINNPDPVVGPALPAQVTKELGQTQTFSATTANENSRQWEFRNLGEILETDWKPIAGATGNSHTTGSINSSHNGRQYRLTAENDQAVVKGIPATLLVNLPPITGEPVPFRMQKYDQWWNAVPKVMLAGVWRNIEECWIRIAGQWVSGGCHTVIPAPVITQQPQDISAKEGDPPVTFSIDYTPPEAEIMWEENDDYLGWMMTGHTGKNFIISSSSRDGMELRVRIVTPGHPLLFSRTAIFTKLPPDPEPTGIKTVGRFWDLTGI